MESALQHASPAGFNQNVGGHRLLNTTRALVFLTLVAITSYEPTEYMDSAEQGRHKPTDLTKPEFSFSFKKAIRMHDDGDDLIGLSNFFFTCVNLGLFLATNCVWRGTLLVTQWYRIPLPVQETWVRSLGQEDTLEEQMATCSSILAGQMPWTEEPGGLQSMGSQKSRT